MIKNFIDRAGWPRLIIGLFLLGLFVAAPSVGVRIDTSLSDTLVRFGRYSLGFWTALPFRTCSSSRCVPRG